jgi:hypothetical protein
MRPTFLRGTIAATMNYKLSTTIFCSLAWCMGAQASVTLPLSEWRVLAQAETLNVFSKDRPVGILVHRVSITDSLNALYRDGSVRRIPVADSAQTIVTTTSLTVAGREDGINGMELFEGRVYGTDGLLRSARQTLKSASGTSNWSLFKSPQGWRLSVESGGETTASIIDDFDESLLPTLEMTKRVKRMLIARGETWRDTQIDLVSGKIISNIYTCTAVDSIARNATFDVTDNITGRHQAWQIDASGKTIVQEIEGLFVAKRAVASERKGKKAEPIDIADLSDLISVPAPRPAGNGERIAVVLQPGEALDASVSGLYSRAAGDRWILTLPQPACSCVAQAAPDSSLALFTRPTATLQSNHPSIVQLARKLKGNESDPCALALAFTKYVFLSLEKRPTATFSNALETLKAGFGDCGEHSVLLAAMLRSCGIPARVVLGLYYTPVKKTYSGHAWVMVWTGTWVFADPAFGVFPACKDRIPLILDDNGRNAVNLTRLLGRIKVEYVAAK